MGHEARPHSRDPDSFELTYPAIIFWCLAVWALLSRGPAIYYLFFAGWSFEMLSVIPAQDIGVSLTPAWISATLLIMKVFVDAGPGRIVRILMHPLCFLPLMASAFYGTVAAFLMPQIFGGHVLVFAVRATSASRSPVFLHPATSNIAQSAYYILSILMLVAAYIICSDPVKRVHFFKAFVFGSLVAIGTGLIDLAAGLAHLGALLKPFRTANYALIDGAEILGVRRIIGLTPEASAYAGMVYAFAVTLSLVPIPSTYFPSMKINRLALCVVLVLMTLGSTSSSGIAGVIGLGGIIGCWALLGAIRGQTAAIGTLFVGLVLITMILGVVLFVPTVSEFVSRMFETLILKKNLTDSYVERSSWNKVSFDAFWATYGLGVGLGSARASSFIPAVLSNLGAPGVLALIVFYVQMLTKRAAAPQDRELANKLKLAVPAGILTLSLGGTSANFGLANAVLYGALLALQMPGLGLGPARRSSSPLSGDIRRASETPDRSAVSPARLLGSAAGPSPRL
jgi:hypothetical protein